MKKVLGMLVAVVLLLGIVPTFVLAEDTNETIKIVQVTDIHYTPNLTECNKVFGHCIINPADVLRQLTAEIEKVHPDLVIVTGDIAGLGDKYPVEEVEQWYKSFKELFVDPLEKNGIKVYLVPGNHDNVGIKYYKEIPENLKNLVGLGLYRKFFGKDYYSFDYKGYHFIALNPKELPPTYRDVELPEEQVAWLKYDLKKNKDKPIIIFYHQPLGAWIDPNQLLDIIKGYNVVALLAGHTHDYTVNYYNGIPEFQAGAVCGSWWRGPTPDYNPRGYMIYIIHGKDIKAFYKGIGINEQINLIEPKDVVVYYPMLRIQVYSKAPLKAIQYTLDNRPFKNMTIQKVYTWYEANAKVETPETGYHWLKVKVITENGSFSKKWLIKVSQEKLMPLSEVYAHFDNFLGRFVTVEGVVTARFVNGKLPVIEDKLRGIPVWAGDVKANVDFEVGRMVRLRGMVQYFRTMPELKLMHPCDAEYITKTPRKISIHDIPQYLGNLVIVERLKVTKVGKSWFIAEDETGEDLFVYTGFKPSVKVGQRVAVEGIAWRFDGKYEVCPRGKNDIYTYRKGDTNLDMRLDYKDIAELAKAIVLGIYNPWYDLNSDGKLDFNDLKEEIALVQGVHSWI
ncbi:metallophosphoesterase [Thermococcus barophilus]|uniref:Putative Metallophosphoesterase n=1 Tax=Thermococcus barophilus TaxID=55802 RepID=A0A0S1XE75_THEBA|nr:metallophosphoesterase [Thermococcus barophilus]ALM76102.1 putative Metallophosphoesterase [Thermococcus barophilus]